MEDFCKTDPEAVGIPAYVTVMPTVYFWKCTNGKPEAVQQITTAAPQGYLAVFWHELSEK